MWLKFRNLFLLAILFPGWLAAAEMEPGDIKQQHLFKIERSKNANIVQYDARVGPDGTLDPEMPVAVYWVRLAEDGRTMQLRFLEKRFAYGFKAAYDPASNSASMVMKAARDRELTVMKTAEGYCAEILIDGHNALLKKIFVQSSRKRFFKKIEYIELHGVDSVTGETRIEKYIP